MKTIRIAIAVSAMITNTVFAQGPPGPNSPFNIWQMQGARGMPLTPMSELMRRARSGEGLAGISPPAIVTPSLAVATNPPAPIN